MRNSEVGPQEILQQEAKSQSPNQGSTAGTLSATEGLQHLDGGVQVRLPVKDSELGEPTSEPRSENGGDGGRDLGTQARRSYLNQAEDAKHAP